MHNLARITLQALRPMALESKAKRLDQFSQLDWGAIPPCLQEFLLDWHGSEFQTLFGANGISRWEVFVDGIEYKSADAEATPEVSKSLRDYAAKGRKIGSTEVYNRSSTNAEAEDSQAYAHAPCHGVPGSSCSEPVNSQSGIGREDSVLKFAAKSRFIGSSEVYNHPSSSKTDSLRDSEASVCTSRQASTTAAAAYAQKKYDNKRKDAS